MKLLNSHLKARLQGAATLIVALVLMMAMALVTLTTTRSGMMEQQMVGNDIRAREAQESAEAGLEYGIAWASKNSIDWSNGAADAAGNLAITCPGTAGCPILTVVSGADTTSSESYGYTLTFTQNTNSVKVESVSQGTIDNTISATSEAYIKQIHNNLFENSPSTKMPEPWVLAGCITTAATGTPDTFMLNTLNNAVVSGTNSSAACLPQEALDVTNWADDNGNGIKDAGEDDSTIAFNRGSFSGCPGSNCAWNYAFDMSLADAKQAATDASHVYTSNIPCGASDSPGIYIVNNGGPINGADISGSCSGTGVDNWTIGVPHKPIVLIIPSASNCPKFNGNITIYGIVYYESTTSCAANGWGGATIYGSVIWEGDVKKPNASSKFIEVNYGSGKSLNEAFNMGVNYATRIPGTWKDF